MCYRLWSEAAHPQRQEATPPEILSADLAPLALQLACSKCAPVACAWQVTLLVCPLRHALLSSQDPNAHPETLQKMCQRFAHAMMSRAVCVYSMRAEELRWLDPPPEEGLAAARSLLQELGAQESSGHVTARGEMPIT